jgi:hypothetical protein
MGLFLLSGVDFSPGCSLPTGLGWPLPRRLKMNVRNLLSRLLGMRARMVVERQSRSLLRPWLLTDTVSGARNVGRGSEACGGGCWAEAAARMAAGIGAGRGGGGGGGGPGGGGRAGGGGWGRDAGAAVCMVGCPWRRVRLREREREEAIGWRRGWKSDGRDGGGGMVVLVYTIDLRISRDLEHQQNISLQH